MVIFLTRIVVFSDTHRNIKDAINVLDNLINVDIVIHLGDCVADAVELKKIYKDISFYYVTGNNDFFSDIDSEIIVDAEDKKLFCVHGHMHNKDRLVEIANKNNCCMALFGHTHRGIKETVDGVTLFNPGSISRPRDGKKSYGIIEIENGVIKSCIVEVQSFF